MKLGQFALMMSCLSYKMYHVKSNTRSLGKIVEKPCVCSRGHTFSSILVKPGQNVCLSDISNEFENLKIGHIGSKTRSPGHRKILITLLRQHFQSSTLRSWFTLVNTFLYDFWSVFGIGSRLVKN